MNTQAVTAEPTIVERGEMKVIGIEFAGPFNVLSEEVPKVWATLLERIKEIPNVVNADVLYGVNKEDLTHQVYRIYICAEVSNFEQIPHGMVGFTVPAKQFAHITHQGPMECVVDTYVKLYGWMKENGHEQDPDFHSVELYDQRYVPTVYARERVENAFEIYVPVRL